MAILHTGGRLTRAKMGRNDPVQFKGWGQDGVDDGILVVGLVFGVGVDDDALFGRGRERDIEDGKIAH